MGKSPTHYLTVKKKEPKESKTQYVGVAWMDEYGRISIKIDACVVLTDRDDVWVSLYPIDQQYNRRPTVPDDGDESMPF